MDSLPDITIESIPRDVLLLMMEYFENDYETLAHVCMVDKYFNEKICNDNYWYEALYRKFSMDKNYVDLIRGNNSLHALFIYMSRPNTNPDILLGFRNPVLISDELRDFFRHAEFGPSDPQDPYSLPLNEVLMVGQNGITSRAILTPLFGLYIKIHRVGAGPHVTATPEMIRYLPKTFETQPRFFRYPDLQRIIHNNAIKKDDLTPIQSSILKSEGVNDILTKDQELVSRIYNHYRNSGIEDAEIWVYINSHNRKILASGFPDKNIGEMILLRKDYEEICQNDEIDNIPNTTLAKLKGIAIILHIEYADNITREELCRLIADRFKNI
jgi:hypothetical protein